MEVCGFVSPLDSESANPWGPRCHQAPLDSLTGRQMLFLCVLVFLHSSCLRKSAFSSLHKDRGMQNHSQQLLAACTAPCRMTRSLQDLGQALHALETTCHQQGRAKKSCQSCSCDCRTSIVSTAAMYQHLAIKPKIGVGNNTVKVTCTRGSCPLPIPWLNLNKMCSHCTAVVVRKTRKDSSQICALACLHHLNISPIPRQHPITVAQEAGKVR